MPTEEFGWGSFPNYQSMAEALENLIGVVADQAIKISELEQQINAAQFLPVSQIPIVQPRNWRNKSE